MVNFVTIVNGSLWVNKASLCITSFHKLTMTDLLLLDQRLPVTWPYGQSYFAQGRINHVDSSKRSVFFLGSKVEGLASSKAALSRNASQVFNFNTRLLAGIELYYIVILLVCDYLLKLSRCSASKWTRSLPPMLAAEGF